MVLVDADAVEAHLFGELQLVQELVVELMALHRVEQLAGHVDPYAVVVLLEVLRKEPVGHQVEPTELHVRPAFLGPEYMEGSDGRSMMAHDTRGHVVIGFLSRTLQKGVRSQTLDVVGGGFRRPYVRRTVMAARDIRTIANAATPSSRPTSPRPWPFSMISLRPSTAYLRGSTRAIA